MKTTNTTDVMIDGVNLFTEYGLEWYDVINEAPPPVTNYCEPPGRNGSIDLTEAVSGTVKYSDRLIKLYFIQDDRSPERWAALCSDLYARYHGQRFKFTLGNDPDFFYVGRLTCQGTKSTYVSSLYEIDAQCEPFKYKNELTTKSCTASAAGTEYSFLNLFAPCKPYFDCSADLSVKQGGTVYSLRKGGVTIPEIAFQKGSNKLSFIGNGNITVKWQEGTL